MRTQILKMFTGTLFLLVLLVPGARAADVAGTVLYTAGKVTAVAADGASRDLQRRSPVYVGDVLQTGGNARAQVRFTDGSIVALKPGSELRLDQYADRGTDDSASVMSLLKGGFRTMTGAISQRNKAAYKVSTPVATIGVRGTLYETSWTEGEGLSLGVWDGGITACNDAGCVDLGMNADHRFGFVPLTGKPQGSTEQPSGIGDDREAGGTSGGSPAPDLIGTTDLLPGALQHAALFGPVNTPSRAEYGKVGYAFLAGGGVVAASYARAKVENFDGLWLTGWSLVDDASGIELSPAPDIIVTIPEGQCQVAGECTYAQQSWSGSANTEYSSGAEYAWGQWDEQVSVGLSAGDPGPSVSEVPGGFVMADYIAADQAQAWLMQQGYDFSAYFQSGVAAESGQLLTSPYMYGGLTVQLDGAVTGYLTVDGSSSSLGTWSTNFTGAVSGGQFSGLELTDSQYSINDLQGAAHSNGVTGHIEASFFGKDGVVGGVVGGVEASTVDANTYTGKVETLEAAFLMAGSCNC